MTVQSPFIQATHVYEAAAAPAAQSNSSSLRHFSCLRIIGLITTRRHLASASRYNASVQSAARMISLARVAYWMDFCRLAETIFRFAHAH